jgi:hypothetical protein
VLELAALAAFGLWGASLSDGATAVLLAIALPVLAAGLWGTLAAPRARRRLPRRPRTLFELGFFLAAAIALWRAGFATAAALFAAAVLVNAFLLTTFDQWEM